MSEDLSPQDSSSASDKPAANRRLLIAFSVVLTVMLLTMLRQDGESLPVEERQPEIGKFSIELQIDDQPVITFEELPLTQGMTVLAATQRAAREDARFAVQVTGSGARAFISQLGEIENAGVAGGQTGRNWQYEVNGELASISCGAYDLKPGDRVLWKHAPYE